MERRRDARKRQTAPLPLAAVRPFGLPHHAYSDGPVSCGRRPLPGTDMP